MLSMGSVGCGHFANGTPAASQPIEGPAPAVIQQLPNGMSVLIHEMPGVGVATADIWIGTGSAHETPEQAGVSHFLEHMLFKGTHRRAPGEMDVLVEGIGGILNAGTSKDFTHYYMTVPATRLPEALDALADAVTSSTLAQAEFDKERGVILEEISRKEDNPAGYLFEQVYHAAFAPGPYGHSVLGDADSISAMTRERMWEYYRARYRPQGLLLVVAGDVAAEEVMARIETTFSALERAEDAPAHASAASQWNAGAVVDLPKDVREVYAAIAFPAPGIDEPDAVIAADVLQAVLSEGRASRLSRVLKEEKGLVSSISASFPTHRHASLFAIAATLAPENLEAFRQALGEELQRVREKTVDDEALQRARRLLINSHHFAKETTGGAASSLGYYYTLTGSGEFEQRYIERIESITAEQVRTAARRILDPAQAVRVTLIPQDTAQ